MKKSLFMFFAVIITAIALSAGCSTNPATGPTGPTATATAVTSAGGVNISVSMQMMDNNGMIGTEQFVIYAADNLGATLNVSSITLTGPTGAITGTITSSVYTYSDFVTTDYVPAGSYTVTVGYNAVNYTGTFNLPGNMTIASDGTNVSWTGAPLTASIIVLNPAMAYTSFGPLGLSSPFNLNASGVYSAGAGTYTITAAVTTITSFAVNNGGAGIATSLQTRMKMIVKL